MLNLLHWWLPWPVWFSSAQALDLNGEEFHFLIIVKKSTRRFISILEDSDRLDNIYDYDTDTINHWLCTPFNIYFLKSVRLCFFIWGWILFFPSCYFTSSQFVYFDAILNYLRCCHSSCLMKQAEKMKFHQLKSFDEIFQPMKVCIFCVTVIPSW